MICTKMKSIMLYRILKYSQWIPKHIFPGACVLGIFLLYHYHASQLDLQMVYNGKWFQCDHGQLYVYIIDAVCSALG